MRSHFGLVLLCCFAATFFACSEFESTTPTSEIPSELIAEEDPDASCELAYEILFLEEELGFNSTGETWGKLDDILNQVPDYAYHDSLSPEQKRGLLRQFEEHLNANRKLIGEYHNVLSICLEWGIFDCDINSILFYSWGQRWGIPIDMHLFPKHMSVSLPGDSAPIFWETTLNKSVDIEYYRKRYGFDETDLIYNRPLSDQEIQAVVYFNAGKEYLDRGNLFRGIILMEQAIALFPEWDLPCEMINFPEVEGVFNC